MDERKKKSYDFEGQAPDLRTFSEQFQKSSGCCDDVNKTKVAAVVVIVLLVIGAAVATAVVLTIKGEKETPPDGAPDRIECPFQNGHPTYDECLKKGCLWSPASNNVPPCFLPKSTNYVVAGAKINTPSGFIVPLEYYSNVTLFSKPRMFAEFRVNFDSDNSLTFEILPKPTNTLPTTQHYQNKYVNPAYEIILQTEPQSPFTFAIVRSDDGQTIWNSSLNGLVLENQFVQISTYLASKNFFGMGENAHTTFKRDLNYKTSSIFSRNSRNNLGQNLGGVHPFYMCVEDSGKAHAVYFHNTHALEYVLLPAPGITLRALGGSLKFTIFLGNSASQSLREASRVLGTAAVIPYWALGFQVSPKFSQKGTYFKSMIEMVKRNFSLDAVYLDPILWEDGKVFDPASIRDADVYNYVKKEHHKSPNGTLHFVFTLEPAVNNESSYDPFKTGLDGDVFIKWPAMDQNPSSIYIGKRTAEPTITTVAYPDFRKKNTQNWWKSLLDKLYNAIPYDGLFLVQNEPYNEEDDQCPESTWDNPAYTPNGLGKLSDGTICMSLIQGDLTEEVRHYEIHNSYGMDMAHNTAMHISEYEQRAFVVSQSTTSLKKANNPSGHWLSRFPATWEGLRRSVVGLLDFSLFGLPYVGTQICGDGKLNENNLCRRWIQLAAFYPFVKVDLNVNSREDFLGQVGVLQTGKSSLTLRYTLLPYMYTVFYHSHLYGDPVIRPLFYEYPDDTTALSLDSQFLWGPNIMVSPILNEDTSDFKVYFPNDTWYRLRSETSSIMHLLDESGYLPIGETTDIPVFVRGGTILACHSETFTRNLVESRKAPLVIKVFPKDEKSVGSLFWDDGSTKNTWKTNKYFSFSFTQNKCSLIINRTVSYDTYSGSLSINEIRIHDVGHADSARFNGQSGRVEYSSNHKILVLHYEVNLIAVPLWTITWDSRGSCLSRADYSNDNLT